ncbi:MAG: SUMF1/EgtB/PvdO family nonheme iron enzyme [Spirochaetota bacterium]|jgi:formylglycine-generating enzyme required for sulfatase activity|nr:SUMF1/EgtB/PvdO family nonheme iron enzyme [Spirochaetota bacterium]
MFGSKGASKISAAICNFRGQSMQRISLIIFMFIRAVSVLSAEQTAKIQTGGQFKVMEVKEVASESILTRPDADMRYIAFDIVIDNTKGAGEIRFNAAFFSVVVRDTEGRTYSPEVTSYALAKPAMPSAAVEAGEFMRGWITVAIPKNISLAGCRIRLDARGRQDDRITSEWITLPGGNPPAVNAGVGTSGAPRGSSQPLKDIASHVMVPIPAGRFLMGSPATETGRFNNETQHSVTITKSFLMGKYAVTQELYEKVVGRNPSRFISSPAYGEAQAKRPVEQVSWYDAIVFCNKLSILEGLSPVYRVNGSTDPASWGAVPTDNRNATWDAVTVNWDANGYRLPTEAEWEYACRAGTTTAYHTGASISDNTGWYGAWDGSGNSDSKTHEVGKKTPNAWGLYDMHGNVWEWVWDWYGEYTGTATDPRGSHTGSSRVDRGGSWNAYAQNLRSALRLDTYYPYVRNFSFGFRVVRVSP